jgi:hypothetical protein
MTHEKEATGIVKKSKVIPVTGHDGGLYGSETLRIPHSLDIWITDGGKVVRTAHRPRFIPHKHYFSFLVLISVRG